MEPQNLSGFDPHIQRQLADLSLNAQSRPESRSSQSSVSQHSSQNHYTTQVHPRQIHRGRGSARYPAHQPQAPPGSDDFPPLGAQQTQPTSNMTQPLYQNGPSQHHPGRGTSYQSHTAAQEFFARARGGRGRSRGRGNHMPNTRVSLGDPNDFSRPNPGQGQHLFNPTSTPSFTSAEQRRNQNQRTMQQSDFLEAAAQRFITNMLSRQEIDEKQRFAERLQHLAAQVVEAQSQFHRDRPTKRVRLQPYGSLANSFGTSGCDVDLLLTIESRNEVYEEVTEAVKRDFEKVLLNEGIGARLLTNTRVPILKVCEKPGEDLLKSLREYRSKWELSAEESSTPAQVHEGLAPLPELSQAQHDTQVLAMENLDQGAADIALPDSPPPDHAKLEYTGDCGIQCDINFANHIALHNSRLLWTYGQCDNRVRAIGIFVKNWAKSRDINTPYRGTLSSYGYILMVLHYLMNVAHPPIIPNLQHMGKNYGWDESAMMNTPEGHDIRFEKDPHRIRAAMSQMPRNPASVGRLLLGFFQYYGQAQGGFWWTDQVISVRTLGGTLTKQEKGWVRAKWSEDNPNVRQRYLLAIEDPFEIDHNVGRTVGHHGLCAIRDEFRRAYNIINTVHNTGSLTTPSWIWSHPNGAPGGDAMELVSSSDARGDLLRKDADGRREKAKKMRQELERQETIAKARAVDISGENAEMAEEGTSEGEFIMDAEPDELEDPTELIHDVQRQDEKTTRMRSKTANRKRYDEVVNDSDPSDGESDDGKAHQIPWSELPTTSSLVSEAHSIQGGQPNTQEKEPFNTDAVGEYIPWTKRSKAGLWLHKRDAMLRNGIWRTPTATDFGRLHTAFPYDPKMSVSRLDEMNKKLELLYKDTLYPSRPADSDVPSPEAAKVVINQAPAQTDGWDQPAEPQKSHRSEPIKTVSEWPVSDSIPWSGNTGAGEWLLWRDRKMRAGQWLGGGKRYNGLADRLSELFPANTSHTLAQVESMNNELERFFRDIEFPRHGMDIDEQKQYTWAMHDAIERTLAQRSENVAPTPPSRLNDGIARPTATIEPQDRTVLSEIYGESRKVTFADHNDEIPSHPDSDHKYVEEYSSSTPRSPLSRATDLQQWTIENDVGRWLNRRDEKIAIGDWEPNSREDSVFLYIDKLYPYDPDVNLEVRAKQNQEIEQYFDGLRLPRYPSEHAEPVVKAILKIFKTRKTAGETNRINFLRGLFEQQRFCELREVQKGHQEKTPHEVPAKGTGTGQSEHNLPTQPIPSAGAITNLDKVQEHNALALQTLTNRVDQNEKDFVRKQRLVFYLQNQNTDRGKMSNETLPGNFTEIPVRRDSGAEGSWNYPPSPPQGPLACYQFQERLTNFEKSSYTKAYQTKSSPTIVIGNLDHCHSGFEAVITEDNDSIEEMIPNSLKPDTWKNNRNDRFENPDIIPIVQSHDFDYDLKQLADIETIMAGGNGCTRGGYSPYMLESDQYSWGGGGAMGQRSHSVENWSSTEMYIGRTSEEENHLRELLNRELPGTTDG